MPMIMIVEDDAFIREIAEMIIEGWGYETVSAGDVGEALCYLRSPKPIDAMFTDIYLKDAVLGGCDLANQAVKLRPTLRVLYTTGNNLGESMRATFVKGSHFLSKPYTEQQLHDSFNSLLAA